MDLDTLIEAARRRPPMTDAERRAQAVSFAFGNVNIDRTRAGEIPRETFEAAYDAVEAEASHPDSSPTAQRP